MIIITRNGQTTVITGWREWLIRIVIFVAAVLLLAVIAFLVLGFAITIGAILMIIVPAAIIVALLGSLFSGPRRHC
jgi:hypothetical protein